MRLSLRPSYGSQHKIVSSAAMALVSCAVFYNAGLATLNAAGIHQSYATVAITELLILAATAVYIAASGIPVLNPISPKIVFFGALVAIYVSFASQSLALDCARATAIIGIFTILGCAATERQVFTVFRLLSALVLAVLIIEITDTSLYVKIFQPAAYYSSTRGVEEFSLDDSGLFRNALGFQGRFSFGLSSHRTASIFIEQVSLANFSGILIIYLLATFDRLKRLDLWLHVATVVLILLTNDSRTSSLFAVVSLVGVYVFPRIPSRATYVIMPLIVLAGFVTVYLFGLSHEDDLQGRISVTIANLGSLEFTDWFGFGARKLGSFMDSGYVYVISGSTIFGLLILWILISESLPGFTAPQRRCLFGLNIYMCFNLMIGGTAVFSIKIAAPLWLLVGYMSNYSTARDRSRSNLNRLDTPADIMGVA